MEPISIAAIAIIVLATIYAFARKALLSLTYAVAFLAIYAFQAATPGPFGIPSIVTFDLGLSYFPGGWPEPWTWITYAFVHGSATHLFLNVLGMVFISPVFEGRVGSERWILLFFGGAVFGALVFRLLNADVSALLVGGSAGILSVFGGYGRLYPRDRVTLFLPLRGLPTVPVLYVVIGFLLLQLVFAVSPTGNIAWEAHAAAIAFGFALAPAVQRIPLPGARVRKLASLEPLRDLATTPDLRTIFQEAERADLPETRDAWIEKFVRAVRCPQCGRPLRRRFGRLSSDCGWTRPL